MTPENVFTLHASYKPVSLLGLTLGGGARRQDKSGDKATNVVTGESIDAVAQAYWLLDASARYEIDKNLSVNVNIRNLLDKRYYTIFYSTYTWGEPRSVNVSMKYRF